jgi:hypothetical protein
MASPRFRGVSIHANTHPGLERKNVRVGPACESSIGISNYSDSATTAGITERGRAGIVNEGRERPLWVELRGSISIRQTAGIGAKATAIK